VPEKSIIKSSLSAFCREVAAAHKDTQNKYAAPPSRREERIATTADTAAAHYYAHSD